MKEQKLQDDIKTLRETLAPESEKVVSIPPPILYDGSICSRHRGGPSMLKAAEHRRCPEERSGIQPTRGPASAGHVYPPRQEPGTLVQIMQLEFIKTLPSHKRKEIDED